MNLQLLCEIEEEFHLEKIIEIVSDDSKRYFNVSILLI
jgi:hypothetical protein